MLTISSAISNTHLRSALIPFITAGYPNLAATSEIMHLLDNEGVNAIELGIPYSDALADGPIIQESSRIALQNDTSIESILKLVRQVNKTIKTPVIIFTYLNPVLSKGIHEFIKDLYLVGVKGLVIPDLPVEESEYFVAVCAYYEIELILFISPATSEDRIQKIIAKAPGCIYLVSNYGVTGLRGSLANHTSPLIQKIKSITSKRIMLGFGISNEDQVARIVQLNANIDAIVMGSAFIDQITSAYVDGEYDKLKLFCKKIKKAMSY